MKYFTINFVLILLALCSISIASGNKDFPLRDNYPNLTSISGEKLNDIFSEAIIIDTRNKVEYNVIHIKGATNILVGKMKKKDLLELRELESSTPIIFYCNGTTCSKSYKATRKAAIWGFNNIYVYNEGIFAWASSFPQQTELFGEVLTKSELNEKLISKEDFNNKCVKPTDFAEKVFSSDYTIYDIRDRKERTETPLHLPNTKKVNLDQFVSFMDKKAIAETNILIFGNVGKQVRWIQYYLEKNNYKNYYFLHGGVRQWVEDGFGSNGKQLSSIDN